MTRLDLRTLVLDYCDDAAGGYFTASVVNTRLNLAMRELQKALITANKQYYAKVVSTPLVNGQANYALPSDFLQIVRIEYVVSGSGDTAVTQNLLPATPNQKDGYLQVSGNPQFYTFIKNNILLQPVPQGTQSLRLTYSYMVADMSADGDTPDAPAQYQEYIAVLAARDCFLKDGRPLGPIESKMAEYRTVMKQIAEQRTVDKPRMVVMTQGGGYGY